MKWLRTKYFHFSEEEYEQKPSYLLKDSQSVYDRAGLESLYFEIQTIGG